MIQLFEDITYELNSYENEVLLPLLIQKYSNRVGKDNVITNRNVCDILVNEGYFITPVRLRKIINYIRNNNLVIGLISTSNGSYVSLSRKEIEDYIISLHQRASGIYTVMKSLERQLEFKDQGKLWKD